MCKRQVTRLILLLFGLFPLLFLPIQPVFSQVPATGGSSPPEEDWREAARTAIDKGLKYLWQQQEKDGTWSHYPGITALALRAFLKSPRKYTVEDGPFIRRPLEYLAGLARPDGSLYDRDLPNYNTSVVLLALQASGNPKYRPLIEGAQRFLVRLQFDEEEGYTEKDPFYGGIGQSREQKSASDLDNLGFALEALAAYGLPAESPVWKKALRFIQRCQNRKGSNDQDWAGDDGGFVFYPGFSHAGGTTSYGSMTCVGISSLMYAGVGKEDPRVRAALDWIQHHYTLEENPGLGAQGLYHYYYFFARAFRAYGEPLILDGKGGKHDWREELVRKLVELQRPDGSWANKNAQWWEDQPVLATSFALLAMEFCLE